MRKIVKDFVTLCVTHLPLVEPVYEFGARHVSGGGASDMRPLFPNKKFVGADLQTGRGVDVVLNLHDIALPRASVGTVLILDTLEHVEFPRRALEEVARILTPTGILILASVMNFHIHAQPDYWRFTPDGFWSLLSPFPTALVDSLGDPRFPHTVLGIGFKPMIREEMIAEFRNALAKWQEAKS